MSFFFAAKMTAMELATYGLLAASVVTLWSYSNWRTAVKIALVVALFEGAIRKWLMPGAQELAYFLKDIFLFGAYLKFMISPDLDVRSYRLNLPVMILCVLGALLFPPALNTNIGSYLLSLYGLKIYLYYIPLVFMMPYLFRNKDEMVRQLTWYSMLAIPICILGVLQFRAGAASPLNVYAQSSAEGISGFGFGEKVRITGTFSYITGHSTFIIFFSTLCIALLAIPQTRHKWVITFITLPAWLVIGSLFFFLPITESVLMYGAAAVFGVPLVLLFNSMGLNPIIALAGMSVIWPLGDALPPTAIIGRLTVDVAGAKDRYSSFLKQCIVPGVVIMILGTLMVIYSKHLGFLTGI